MDSISIKFNYNNCEYCYRVPDNFNWFEMFRIKNISSNFYLYESIIYNDGKIFFNSFLSNNSSTIIDFSYRTEKHRESLLYDFIRVLIINNGKNNNTLNFINKLNIDINKIFNYEYSTNAIEFFSYMNEDINNDIRVNKEIVKGAENIINNNPYNILGIEEKEYSEEELTNIFNNKMNILLDAYNTIKNNNIKIKKLKY